MTAMHSSLTLRIFVLLAVCAAIVCGGWVIGRVFKNGAQRLREAWAKAVGISDRPRSLAHLWSACRQVCAAEPVASILFVFLGVVVVLFAFARFWLPHALGR